MATASSVQREPSMEEILASIRRIIEDSDSGRKPAEAFEHAGDDAGVPEEPAPAVVDVFRNELRSGTEPVPLKASAEIGEAKQAEAEPAHPAEAEPAHPAEAGPAHPAAAVADSEPQDDGLPASSSFRRIDFTRADLSRPAAAVPEKPVAKPDDWRVPLNLGSVDRSGNSGQPDIRPGESVYPAALHGAQNIPGEEPLLAEKADAAPLESAPSAADANDIAAAKPALVSERTSRQVAAAFGELSDAFAARSKKSLDEMAEEMLRPMLQEWLDNNLPTLVERLVREEIERVARGA